MSGLINSLGLLGSQLDAVQERAGDTIVTAGAGSGKTKILVARYLALLDEGRPPRAVAAITFTDKAAREMRNRIRAQITLWREGGCPADERERWEEIEAEIDTARIGTIHSLCAALLRAHPAEAGIDPQVSVLDEGLAAALRAQAVEEALHWATEQEALQCLFQEFETRALQSALSKMLGFRLETRQALALLLTHGDIATFWNTAIGESIRAFVRQSAVAEAVACLVELAESGGLRDDAGDKLAEQVKGFLLTWAELEQAHKQGEVMAAAQALLTLRREYCNLNVGKKTSMAKEALRTVRDHYTREVNSWLGGDAGKASPLDPAMQKEMQQVLIDLVEPLAQLFARVEQVYTEAKDLRQALDFDDLEAGAVQLLERADVRARWQSQIAALLVDEFQDTNERQRRIVEALAGVTEGHSGRLFVVGDAKQSIYRFRGADVGVFRRLDSDIRNRGGRPLALDLTFRAHPSLLATLNELLGKTMGDEEEANRPYVVPFAPLRAWRKDCRSGVQAPYVEFLYGLGEKSEQSRPAAAALLVRRLVELRELEGFQWSDFALLFRAASGFVAYEEALEEASIPFVTVAGQGFYERPEIRDILNILRAVADPWDNLAMAGLLRSPAFALSDVALYQLRWAEGQTPVSFRQALNGDLSHLGDLDRAQAERARRIVAQLNGLLDRVPVADLLKEMLDLTMYPAILAASTNGARLQRNIDKLLADAQTSGLVRVSEFLEYVETLRASGVHEGEAPAEAGSAVRLMTVHRAKGLEFPVVVIADASHGLPNKPDPVLLSSTLGLVPQPRSLKDARPLIGQLARAFEQQQDRAEDRRVLYVAATRAREKLLVCGHQSNRLSNSWLGQLAEAAGLDLASLAKQPDERQTLTLPQSGQTVAALASAGEFESEARTELEPALETESADGTETNGKKKVRTSEYPKALYGPLLTADAVETTETEAEQGSGRIQLVGLSNRYRRTEGKVLGQMVHEAIRRWCFPGEQQDALLDSLLKATALAEGLVDQADIKWHVRQAREFLARLRDDPRWAEMDTARRWHEVQYSVKVSSAGNGNGESRLDVGVMDLLYRRPDGVWQVVDFKTDTIADEEGLRKLTSGEYKEQAQRYKVGASHLLRGAPTEAVLCFLDVAGAVRWEQV